MFPSIATFLFILGILVLASIFNYLFSFLQWYMAVNAGLKITLGQLFTMRRKGYPVNVLMDNLIKAKHFNIPVTLEQLHEHHQNGGDVYNLVDGMVRAKKYGLVIPLEKAREADLKKVNLTREIDEFAEKRGMK